jgi:hypothetical protein
MVYASNGVCSPSDGSLGRLYDDNLSIATIGHNKAVKDRCS